MLKSFQVKLEEGIEILKIFKDYNAQTSILDDFDFYDEQERTFTERKARQACSTADIPDSVADESVKEISDILGQALKLEVSSNEVLATEQGGSSRADATVDYLSRVLRLEESCNEAPGSETGVGREI